MPGPNRLSNVQISIKELFFATTVCAILVGVYVNIGRLPAMIGGSILVVVGVIWLFGPRQLVLGGLTGFVAAAILSWLIIILETTDTTVAVGLSILLPATGYVLGACITDFYNGSL